MNRTFSYTSVKLGTHVHYVGTNSKCVLIIPGGRGEGGCRVHPRGVKNSHGYWTVITTYCICMYCGGHFELCSLHGSYQVISSFLVMYCMISVSFIGERGSILLLNYNNLLKYMYYGGHFEFCSKHQISNG